MKGTNYIRINRGVVLNRSELNWPKISIVTPSFNQGQFIEQTIDSVLSQGYPNLEYIIIDGGSNDQSVEIIRRYEKHLTHWVSEPDSGQSEAINKGLKRATGDVFNWLNSDDFYAPHALRHVGDHFADPSVNVLAAKSTVVLPDGTSFQSRGTDVYHQNLAKTIGWARIDQPETFFRKPHIDAIGGVNVALRYLMDRDLWIRYLLRFGMEGIRESADLLVNFRIHEDSKTGSQGASFNDERDSYFATLAVKGGHQKATVFDQLCTWELLKIEAIEDQTLLDHVLNYFLVKLGEEYYSQDDRQRARVALNAVNPANLDMETRAFFNKIRFRNQYIPLWMVRLFRRR